MKAEAIDGLYDNMETSEGQKDVYRIAAARDRAGKDIGQIVRRKTCQIELNPLKKHVFEVFAFLASLRHLANISG